MCFLSPNSNRTSNNCLLYPHADALLLRHLISKVRGALNAAQNDITVTDEHERGILTAALLHRRVQNEIVLNIIGILIMFT